MPPDDFPESVSLLDFSFEESVPSVFVDYLLTLELYKPLIWECVVSVSYNTINLACMAQQSNFSVAVESQWLLEYVDIRKWSAVMNAVNMQTLQDVSLTLNQSIS